MSDIAIRVENLGKMYRIGGRQERYQTFRDTLTNAVLSPFKKARALIGGQAYGASNLSEDMWALKDVSFEIKKGEVIGIIGRNGAGKSTLLKILSRITEPTTGYVDIYGRVGALLEVGTGFHPELTGRENIYLNGTILGMSRKEIDRKFDEIVDFSGVEKFIDTPVKHYSSGMGLRLGFAVAAHLEPEILIVDEVLAVGDAEFQKKCLGKISDVAGEGRTVLFVSHNMAAVRTLCSSACLLQQGVVIQIGDVTKVMNTYQRMVPVEYLKSISSRSKGIHLENVQINNDTTALIDSRESFNISFDIHVFEALHKYSLYCIITDSNNQVVVHSTVQTHNNGNINEFGLYKMEVEYPPLWLRPGLYGLQVKMIVDKLGVGRYVSDTLSIDVIGETDPHKLIGYLVPHIESNFYLIASD
jgi:lipopolysaccharide transport system ATP-binding protein